MSARALLGLGLVLALGALPAARGQDFTGTWDVTGSAPGLGAYAGSATVERAAAGGYRVTRLVRVAQPLPDGRALVLSWHGEGRDDAGALRLDVDLRQLDFIAELGGVARTAQQRAPLRVGGRLQDPGGAPVGVAQVGQRLAARLADPSGAVVVADDVWVKVARVDPPHPGIERRLESVPTTVPVGLFFRVFASYHTLPDLQPYVARPEFQAASHSLRVDTTGRAYTRAHPDHVLVVQKVPDAIALAEERLRADAFRWRLAEKARGWDDLMVREHVEASTGMLGGVDTATGAHVVHGDSALHQGVWVASQAWRYEATGDPAALANVELGTRAIVAMVDAPGRPDEFARGVQEAATAPPSWTRSTTLPGVAYLPGGNNDMLHGVEYGFAAADRVLPAGHPLRAEIGRCATSLVLNHKVAKRGKHALILGDLATRITGDPAARSTYRRVLTWSPLERLWLLMGEGTTFLREINTQSGPHLATCTFASLRVLGGASPGLLERSWRWLADAGLRRAHAGTLPYRAGNLAVVAAAAGAAGASDVARDVLAEVPYPRAVGAARFDHSIDAEFCLSPWPVLPWKFDWMTDPGRQQGMTAYPLWEVCESDNYWKEGPFYKFRGPQSSVRWSPQDWLHAYWYGRNAGALGPND